jgi:hypothetical protein
MQLSPGTTSESKRDFDLVRNCPTLYTYLLGVNATIRNFRRYVIEERDEHAYRGWRTLGSIRLQPDGTIKCSDPQYDPTKEQAARIAEEVKAANFPSSIAATRANVDQLKTTHLRNVADQDITVFMAPDGEKVLFVQQRTYKPNGIEKQADLPWSFYSDGAWRNLEPDDGLPLWGLDRIRKGTRFLVHEGAMGAKKVRQLVDAGGERLTSHPWCEDLKRFQHLGWPGGTDRIKDVNWGPLQKLGPEHEVVFVADNDRKGKEAVTKISQRLLRSLSVIMFDDCFPNTFDLADPWPQRPEWWKGKRYVGPTFDDLRSSATWATRQINFGALTATGLPAKPIFKVRNEFADEWVWVENVNAFVNRQQTNRLLTTESFDRAVKPFSHVSNTSDLLVEHLSSHVRSGIYRPGAVQGVINVKGQGSCINIYRPPIIAPIKGDAGPFDEFMELLIPDEGDRHQTWRWCATLLAQLHYKMLYAVLLASEQQGVGKSTLGLILAELVGLWNASFPDEQEIVDSTFNEWVAHKRLAVVQEIHSGHSWKAYNVTKSVITDPHVTVKRKYIRNYLDENWVHIFACSNNKRPLMIEDKDRRWLMPGVTEVKQPEQYWTKFYAWLHADGLGIIKRKALDFPDYVKESENASPTTVKRRAIAESRTRGQEIAFDLGKHVAWLNQDPRNQKVVLLVSEVHRWVAGRLEVAATSHKFDRPLMIRRALLEAGLVEIPRVDSQTKEPKEDPRFAIEGEMTVVVANFTPPWPVASFRDQLKPYYKHPREVARSDF